MIRWIMLVFSVMTILATIFTFNSMGLDKQTYVEKSIREGSSSGGNGSFSSGGYRYGK